MEIPRIAQITWLLKKNPDKIELIGFIRDHNNGFFIIGGKTGSHYSGHSEHWEDKWSECLSTGFIPENSAKELYLIESSWSPPKIKDEDREIIEKIQSGIL